MSKENDTLTLLNLACIKYTGFSLPVSEFDANNWRYELDWSTTGYWTTGGGRGNPSKKAVWSPHPYFNPLHLYYPSNDFGARVMRRLIVEEIDFILHARKRLEKQFNKELSNQFGYKGAFAEIQINENPYCKFAKIRSLFISRGGVDGRNQPNQPPPGIADPPQLWNQHSKRTNSLDSNIIRRKFYDKVENRRASAAAFTKKGTLVKKRRTAEIMDDWFMMNVGMSNTSNFYCPHPDGYHNKTEYCLKLMIRETKIGGAAFGCDLQKIIGEVRKERASQLTPADYVEIFNPSHIDKKDKIDRALLTNFPH
tara:strand:+ start:27 stop:956 length:930 start_codon:yes stop_codon:yes gene_type:complete